MWQRGTNFQIAGSRANRVTEISRIVDRDPQMRTDHGSRVVDGTGDDAALV